MKVGFLALVTSLFLICFGLPAIAGQPDTDGDSIPDKQDNCPTISNASQADGDNDTVGDACDNCSVRPQASTQFCDTNSDGYGNICDADYNQDNVVGIPDLTTYLLPNFNMTTTTVGGTASPDVDADCDNVVGIPDLTGTLLPSFNMQQGPSGLACAGSTPCTP